MKLNIQLFADGDVIIEARIDSSKIEDDLDEVKEIIEDEDIEVPVEVDTDSVEVEAERTGSIFTTILSKSFGKIGKVLAELSKILSAGLLVGIGAVLVVAFALLSAFAKLIDENEEINYQWQAIRNTMSNALSQIGSTLANMFLPLLQTILNFIQRIIQYVGYILKAWFGIDIFAKKTSEATKTTANSLKSGSRSAKEIKKQLAGFDEMNILNDNKSSAGGGGGGGIDTGSLVDDIPLLKPLLEADVPKWLKWIKDHGELIKAILVGIGTVIGGPLIAIIAYWDEIKAILSKAWKWLKSTVIDPVVDGLTQLWNKIVQILNPVIDLFKNIFNTVLANIKITIENIRQVFVFLWTKIKEIFTPVAEFFKGIFDKAREKVKTAFEPIINFFSQIWDRVKVLLKTFGTKVGEVIGGAFKSAINSVLKAIENILNFPIKAINKLINTINKVPGINLTKLQTFSLPRLAKGGIINMPSRGIPIGGALAGERGAEGVIPLTDSQQMALLGEAIGRYITINANITNNMNGRVISRELQKIQQENSFASNR